MPRKSSRLSSERHDQQITVFNSAGLGLRDLTALELLNRRA
jgi:ornithine cyclodeaminase/alanine dehydrogenase-like protein (mu-crystallin family)